VWCQTEGRHALPCMPVWGLYVGPHPPCMPGVAEVYMSQVSLLTLNQVEAFKVPSSFLSGGTPCGVAPDAANTAGTTKHHTTPALATKCRMQGLRTNHAVHEAYQGQLAEQGRHLFALCALSRRRRGVMESNNGVVDALLAVMTRLCVDDHVPVLAQPCR
jgi:hypothetical protein